MDDAEAIARLKSGDMRGFDWLIQAYQVQSLRVAYLITKDRALAEDVVQTAFLRVYEKIDQLKHPNKFGAWLMKIVVNQALHGCVSDNYTTSFDTINETFVETRLALNPDPTTSIENAETIASIRAAINQLSPLQRTVIVQRYYLEMSEAAMAHDLNCSPGTIKSRLHAARTRLRAIIETTLAL